MDAFHREANPQRRFARYVEQVACGPDQQRAQPFATTDGGMAHGFIQARARVVRNAQQSVERPVHLCCDDGGTAGDERRARSHALHGERAQSAPNGCAPVTVPLGSTVSF